MPTSANNGPIRVTGNIDEEIARAREERTVAYFTLTTRFPGIESWTPEETFSAPFPTAAPKVEAPRRVVDLPEDSGPPIRRIRIRRDEV